MNLTGALHVLSGLRQSNRVLITGVFPLLPPTCGIGEGVLGKRTIVAGIPLSPCQQIGSEAGGESKWRNSLPSLYHPYPKGTAGGEEKSVQWSLERQANHSLHSDPALKCFCHADAVICLCFAFSLPSSIAPCRTVRQDLAISA